MKSLILTIVLILIVLGGFWYFRHEAKAPTTSELPVATATPSSATDKANIHIFSPKAGDKVGTSFIIIGEARTFENEFLYRIRDEDGSILKSGSDYANAPDVGQYGSFAISISDLHPRGKKGTIEVYDLSAKNGSEIELVKVPVLFK